MKRLAIFSLCVLSIITKIFGAEKSSITNNCSEDLEMRYSIIRPKLDDVFVWDVIASGQTKKCEGNLMIHELKVGNMRKKVRVPVFVDDEISISQKDAQDISICFAK